MGKSWKWLAKIFAFMGVCVGLFGIGTFTQINGITSAVHNFFDANNAHTVQLFGMDYSWSVVISGILLTICVALVVIGWSIKVVSPPITTKFRHADGKRIPEITTLQE